MLPALDTLLEYHHPEVLARYCRDFPDNVLPAPEAFQELLKYLWLGVKHDNDRRHAPDNPALWFTCSMHAEMRELDDLWHTFLQFHKPYQDFCMRFFGRIIHHYPFSPQEHPADSGEEARELTCYLSFIADNLGEETLKKWFQE